jgi:magnesium transporter
MFEATLAESLVIAFFLTLVLGLGESVSIQSMTLTVQALHTAQPDLKWYLKNLFKESQTAFLLGISCGAIVALVIIFWKGAIVAGISVGLSIVLVEMMAAFWGLSVPSLLHKTKLDPKIAAGPITLALADISTIIFYLGLATILI